MDHDTRVNGREIQRWIRDDDLGHPGALDPTSNRNTPEFQRVVGRLRGPRVGDLEITPENDSRHRIRIP